MQDRSRRALNLIFALLLFPAANFHGLTGIGRPVGDNAVAVGFSPELPAGYAFAIWGPIFALTLIYAVRQALPSQAGKPLYSAIGWATALSSLANVAWMMLAQTIGNGWWLVVIIFIILAAALTAFLRLKAWPGALDTFDRYVVWPMAAMLAAWLSAAAWIGTASAIRLYRPDLLGLTSGEFAMIVLALVTVLGWSVLRRTRGDAWFAATLVWALAAVTVANATTAGGDRTVATAAAGIALITVAIALLLPVHAARHAGQQERAATH